MTRPMPIHHPGRELRTEPHESEPAHGSYDPSSYDAAHGNNPLLLYAAETAEDQFHLRLQASKQQRSGGSSNNGGGGGGAGGSANANPNSAGGGNSFWRTGSGAKSVGNNISKSSEPSPLPEPVTPSLRSVVIEDSTNTQLHQTNSRGLLGDALQSRTPPHATDLDEWSDEELVTHTVSATPITTNRRRWDAASGGARDSFGSNGSNNNGLRETTKKQRDQQRRAEVRLKRESMENQVEAGHPTTGETVAEPHHSEGGGGGGFFSDLMSHQTIGGRSSTGTSSLERASSDQSTGSILYGKTPNTGAILGRGTSLIFPTGVESRTTGDRDSSDHHHISCVGSVSGTSSVGSGGVSVVGAGGGSHHSYHHSNSTGSATQESSQAKKSKINLLLDQCETTRFRFKKKLILSNLGMTRSDIPVGYLCGTALGNLLHKLSLSGNHLGSIPDLLVQSLPTLKHLDLSQCRLHCLPSDWNLPQLKKLVLSTNLLRDFPEEPMLAGLPELQELDMFGNKVAAIVVPHNQSLLSRLEILNLGYNDISHLPDELDQLRALRVLKIRNNFVNKVPMRVCDMDLKIIDVSSNPVSVPPLETCERGICSMKRYYQQVRMEDQSKNKTMEELQKRVARGKGKNITKKKGGYSGFMKGLHLAKGSSSSVHKKHVTTHSATIPSTSSVSTPHVLPTKQTSNADAKHLEAHEDIVVEPLPKPALVMQTSDEHEIATDLEAMEMHAKQQQEITVNDTLKVIFVGMAMVGKTSMIKRLIEGRHAVVPTHDERTVGVDIYHWDPKQEKRFEHIDSRIVFQDEELALTCGEVDVKFSVWDFAGQHVYHATHELFFSNNALYVLVWDMGANNEHTQLKQKPPNLNEQGDFKLSYDSESEGEGDELGEARGSDDHRNDRVNIEDDSRRADRALERDIDEKVQFWVDCIQSSAPGAAILPVASFADYFENEGGPAESKRRCNMLKERLLRHEQQRIEGIQRRFQEFKEQNRADDPAAYRLCNLLCPSSRPKLIFGEGDEDSVVRVSGTMYSGFDRLTEKITDIATGRYRGTSQYPLFFGHVGTRIPRMRLQVRDAVKTMRDRFKVVEWGYFINQVRDNYNITSVEDISDALHFLTSIGELSYFGGNMDGGKSRTFKCEKTDQMKQLLGTAKTSMDSASKDKPPDDDDDLEDEGVLSIDDTSITAPGSEDGSLSTVEDFMASSLSQFVFLNPRWLVAGVACILRHDLDREIKETRRLLEGKQPLDRTGSFQEASLNCPVITAEDALMLWQAKKITKKAAERAQAYSNNMTVTPFEFLQLLLIRFGVFVPIDLSIDKALLGGKEYAKLVDSIKVSSDSSPRQSSQAVPSNEVSVEPTTEELALKAKFFFLPSLLGPGEPAEVWTYKNTEFWKTTLCHSVLFPDGVPPGLMERLTACVLSAVYSVSTRQADTIGNSNVENATYEGHLIVREVLCWRTAFFLKLGTLVVGEEGEQKESIVEIFCHLADRDSRLCVGSDYMAVGTRRIIVSGRGQIGDGGRKIWKGGYLLVCKCITRVMEGYGGLEYEKHALCPDCLAKKSVSEAGSWEYTAIRSALKTSERTLRCHHGHVVDIRLLAGPGDSPRTPKDELLPASPEPDPVSVQELLGAIVLVGLWDGKSRKVVRAGSGVIVDRKRGLIVTAAHTLINVWGDSKYPFGEDYYGLQQGKVVIGIIPDNEDPRSKRKGMAVFRYFAKIVAKDPSFELGECHLDACVLRITTRMESDVGGNGEGCGDQPEILLLNNEKAFREESLKVLRVSEKCELEEQVRILGFNQGGEALLKPGVSLNRFVDFARGYICKKFASSGQVDERPIVVTGKSSRDCFKPREEIAVICPTIGGHSGGPCVNQQGEVIGILSRADPADNQRCYLSPASEWKPLIKQAKKSDRNWNGAL